ncbi:MAG: general secretion pathway protein GspK [Verrucomicrobia bacterium]|nr:general secretion pathway protein GspK [Verrucomicrobiota bacterium]
MRSPRQWAQGRRRSRGVALVIVLLTLFALGAMAAVFAYSMKVETRLAMNTSNATELEWLGRSGVEYAKWLLVQQDRVSSERGFHALNQFWAGGPGPIESADNPFADLSLQNVPVGEGFMTVHIEDTERLLNINREARNLPLLDLALSRAGADATDATLITGALTDWLDRDDFPQSANGAESEYYRGMDPPYVAKNGPIDDIRELLLIRGVTPEIFWGPDHRTTELGSGRPESVGSDDPSSATPVGLVSIFGALSNGRVNINTTRREVIALLLGGDESLAGEVVKIRAGPDGIDGTEDDQPARGSGEIPRLLGPAGPGFQDRFTVQSSTFEVHVQASLGPAKRRFTALIRRAGARGYETLYFRQD